MLLCETAQGHQTHTGDVLVRKPSIVASADAFVLDTVKAHTNPTVEEVKLFLDCAKGGSKVIGIPYDDPIESTDDLLVEIMGAFGKRANIVFEFLHRLLANRDSAPGDTKPQEVETPLTSFSAAKGTESAEESVMQQALANTDLNASRIRWRSAEQIPS